MIDYREEFLERVNALSSVEDIPTIEERNDQVNKLIEEYFEITGEVPKPHVLERLGNYLLLDTLRDMSPHKVKQTEYPVLSKYQQKRRTKRHVLMESDKLDWFNERRKNNPNTRKVRRTNKDE